MLTYGTQVNPALLRQDFSSILQGAQAQAQATQQAAQIRAQAMASATSTISEGFKTYVKNREQNSVLDGRIGRILSSRPELANDPELKPLFDERAKKGGLPLDKSQKLYSALETTLELDKVKEDRQRQQAYLQLQKDAAAINTERAAREKAEYTRRNTFQENIIRLAKENPDVLKDPKMAVQAVLSAGGNYEDAQRIQGNAITQQQFDLELTQRNMELAKRSLELAEAARRGEVTGKEPDVKVVEQNGVKLVYLLDALKQPIGQPHVVAQGKPDEGSLVESEALRYLVAEAKGDTAGMARHMINIKSKVKNSELMGEEQIRANYIQPFASGGNEPLKVQKVTPSSAKPAPTAEASAITQPANPTDAAAVPPMLARPSAGPAARASAYAPQPSLVFDESSLDRLSGQKQKRPFAGTIGSQGFNNLTELNRQAPERLNMAELLRPQKGDSADTLAVKQIIPYLPNKELSDKLLRDLQKTGKAKFRDAFDVKSDPISLQMFEAAKEGRLQQVIRALQTGPYSDRGA